MRQNTVRHSGVPVQNYSELDPNLTKNAAGIDRRVAVTYVYEGKNGDRFWKMINYSTSTTPDANRIILVMAIRRISG